MKGALAWPFVRLYVLTLLYFSANSILNVMIPLQGEALGASNTTIGIIMGAYLFTTMVFRPWAGQFIQRHGPVRVLRAVLAVNGLALVLYAFTGLGGYFVARVLQGVCTAFFSMALQLGIIDALPDKDRSQGISLYSLCSYMPGIIGPLIAVGMWQKGEMTVFATAMVALAVLTGATGYTATMNGEQDTDERQKRQQQSASASSSLLQSFGQLVSNPHLFRSSALMLSASLVFGAVTTFMPLYAAQLASGSAAVYLMLQAAVVVAARFALKSKIPSDGKWHTPFMTGTMLLIIVASLSISLSAAGGALLLYAGAVLMGVAQAILYPTLTTYLSFVLPTHSRNALLGLFIATADLGVSLGGIVMGPIADLLSYSAMYGICAVIGLAALLIASWRRSQRLERS